MTVLKSVMALSANIQLKLQAVQQSIGNAIFFLCVLRLAKIQLAKDISATVWLSHSSMHHGEQT